ncbi:twin-arginine translocation signal domain-containing protein [Pseudodesulfovibrio sp. F-1]|uniref:Twin-arginine translocation signal domain-containing protein n=1 Tax=Pseudodesulfovibrio alkaliphilus TaxID=2661613 RepID=A0A7K1KP67_9BACT|nr:iron hydrogenase small subunit [Pseudodesulfovibrio alkaliphilus]MUM77770.1 twin-arginine translocation signal domain-containing protein [Pseudodesulfovibrio alkaliphilus]
MIMNRRAFIKACGIMTGYAVLSLNMVKEAAASAMDFVGIRQKSVYDADANPKIYKIRKSQDNPMVKKIYDPKTGYLVDGPCGNLSYHLLHTHYVDRSAKVAALKAKGFKLNF